MSNLKDAAAGAVGAAVAALAIGRPCLAQVRVEVTPLVGFYAPTQYVASSSTGWTLRQDAGLLLGGTVTVWLARWIGVEGSVGWSGWGVSYPVSGGSCADTLLLARMGSRAASGQQGRTSPDVVCGGWEPPVGSGGSVTLSSARLLLNVPVTARTSVYITGGPTTVSRGGIGQDRASVSYLVGFDAPTSHGRVVGAGVRVPLPRIGVTLRAEAADYRYSQQVSATYLLVGTKVQNDLVVSLGLSAAISGRGGQRR